MEEYVFDVVCDVCETHCEITLDENCDSEPAYCPMCASPVEA